MRLVVMLLALSMGGFQLFDGVHGFVTGRYVTPDGVTYGPWTHVVEALGLVPDSHPVRAIFVLSGLVWLAALVDYARRRPGARRRLCVLSVLSTWYLTVGTLHCLLILALLHGVRSLRAD